MNEITVITLTTESGFKVNALVVEITETHIVVHTIEFGQLTLSIKKK